MDKKFFENLLPDRPLDSHKGDYGKVLVVAGSRGMSGAAYLASEAALRSGSGLVYLAIPESINDILEAKTTEVITIPLAETSEGTIGKRSLRKLRELTASVDILAIGPGISRNGVSQMLVRDVISKASLPMVVDGDGINAFVGHMGILKNKSPKSLVITPHREELARLIGRDASFIDRDREGVALSFARDYDITLVLKGHNTVVTDGVKKYINDTGNPGMATAGSGDVLTGMIASFIGQKINRFDASCLAVYLHGLAGDIAAREKTEYSMTATDILGYIPSAMETLLV